MIACTFLMALPWMVEMMLASLDLFNHGLDESSRKKRFWRVAIT